MICEYNLRLLPHQAYNTQSVAAYVAHEKAIPSGDITHIQILRRSIDARGRTVYVNLAVRVYVNEAAPKDVFEPVRYGDVSSSPAVIVVGAGPAGLFAALRLIQLGKRPVIVERGRDVHNRKRDVARLVRSGTVDEESNYCFGEGGAGAFSDGKLYTRSKKRGSVENILRVLCQHGASESILYDVHPHIGSDRLPRVIENMRNTILRCGGEVMFSTRMSSLIIHKGCVEGIVATRLTDHSELTLRGPVILATGHSARDVYSYLNASGVKMEAKGIAVGVRLEHPSALIDRIQYHHPHGRGQYLPPAEYTFTTQVGGRGVYSFCMCPGGVVIPSATCAGEGVVNGMSASHRGGKWSNAGLVVEVRADDIPGTDVMRVARYQHMLESLSCRHGGGKLKAPAQRMTDFCASRLSTHLPATSYLPGISPSPLHEWMPEMIASRLQTAFRHFGTIRPGFLTREATLIAMETRTSAPVTILRDSATLQHVDLPGLYPCGEGAGYAGGIVSAAIDGERCAEMAASIL